MSMPKGFKKDNGYATSKDFGGKTYHEIASFMQDQGYKMNHSTARNVFVTSLIKIASQIIATYDLKMTKEEIKRIAIDPRFQSAICHFMSQDDEV